MKIRRRSRISIDLYDTHIIPAVREAKLQGKSTISVFELLVEGQTLTTEDLLRLSRFGTLYKTYIKSVDNSGNLSISLLHF